MPAPARREREKQAFREEILAAARDMFVEQGYESVSMRKIAEKIEYSPTAIYLYFKDKSEILNSICEETFAKLDEELEELAASAGHGKADPVEYLRKGLHAYVDFGLEHPSHYQLVFLTKASLSLRPGAEPAGMRVFGHLKTAVKACIEAKKFDNRDVDEVSQALWACVHGVTALLVQQPGFPFVKRKKLIRCVIDTVVAGLEQ